MFICKSRRIISGRAAVLTKLLLRMEINGDEGKLKITLEAKE